MTDFLRWGALIPAGLFLQYRSSYWGLPQHADTFFMGRTLPYVGVGRNSLSAPHFPQGLADLEDC